MNLDCFGQIVAEVVVWLPRIDLCMMDNGSKKSVKNLKSLKIRESNG